MSVFDEVSVMVRVSRVPSRCGPFVRFHANGAPGKSSFKMSKARSREPVPCGCQQPPKSTMKAGPEGDLLERPITYAMTSHTSRAAVARRRPSSSQREQPRAEAESPRVTRRVPTDEFGNGRAHLEPSQTQRCFCLLSLSIITATPDLSLVRPSATQSYVPAYYQDQLQSHAQQ